MKKKRSKCPICKGTDLRRYQDIYYCYGCGYEFKVKTRYERRINKSGNS